MQNNESLYSMSRSNSLLALVFHDCYALFSSSSGPCQCCHDCLANRGGTAGPVPRTPGRPTFGATSTQSKVQHSQLHQSRNPSRHPAGSGSWALAVEDSVRSFDDSNLPAQAACSAIVNYIHCVASTSLSPGSVNLHYFKCSRQLNAVMSCELSAGRASCSGRSTVPFAQTARAPARSNHRLVRYSIVTCSAQAPEVSKHLTAVCKPQTPPSAGRTALNKTCVTCAGNGYSPQASTRR